LSDLPIGDYALLSDCHSAALVSRGGSVDWLCFPRFDSPSIFGRLLDDDAGHWSIRPVADAEVTRRYRDDTMVLETTFRAATGVVELVDALAVGRNERGHELGADAPSVLLRCIGGISGEVEVEMEYSPRPEYGLVYPLLEAIPGGLAARGGADVMKLCSPVPVEVDEFDGRARFTVRDGETYRFALDHKTTSQEPPRHWEGVEIEDRLADTSHAWTTWSEIHQKAGPAQRAGAVRAHLLPHRCDLRRGHDVAARDAGR
jgi:GH15 family glucan-1,4-alpha-glucosidase